jgi:hypothetical protein
MSALREQLLSDAAQGLGFHWHTSDLLQHWYAQLVGTQASPTEQAMHIDSTFEPLYRQALLDAPETLITWDDYVAALQFSDTPQQPKTLWGDFAAEVEMQTEIGHSTYQGVLSFTAESLFGHPLGARHLFLIFFGPHDTFWLNTVSLAGETITPSELFYWASPTQGQEDLVPARPWELSGIHSRTVQLTNALLRRMRDFDLN